MILADFSPGDVIHYISYSAMYPHAQVHTEGISEVVATQTDIYYVTPDCPRLSRSRIYGSRTAAELAACRHRRKCGDSGEDFDSRIAELEKQLKQDSAEAASHPRYRLLAERLLQMDALMRRYDGDEHTFRLEQWRNTFVPPGSAIEDLAYRLRSGRLDYMKACMAFVSASAYLVLSDETRHEIQDPDYRVPGNPEKGE